MIKVSILVVIITTARATLHFKPEDTILWIETDSKHGGIKEYPIFTVDPRTNEVDMRKLLKLVKVIVVMAADEQDLRDGLSLIQENELKQNKRVFIKVKNLEILLVNEVIVAKGFNRQRQLMVIEELSDDSFNVYTFPNAGSRLKFKCSIQSGRKCSLTSGDITNLEGQLLTAATFQFEPYIFVAENPDGSRSYSGVEIRLVDTIAEALNFKVQYQPPSDGLLWGNAFDNGTGTGTRGDVIHGRVTFGFAQIFVNPQTFPLLDFTQAYEHEGYCFFNSKPSPFPAWFGLIRPFPGSSWLGILVSLAVVAVFLSLYSLSVKDAAFKDGSDIFVYIAENMTRGSSDIVPRNLHLRPFYFSFMVSCFILTICYSGSLVSYLTIPSSPPFIHTIDDIIKTDIVLGYWGEGLKANLEVAAKENPKYLKLMPKLDNYWDQNCAFQRAESGGYIMTESRTFLNFKLRERFTNRFGETSMYIMNECAYFWSVALMMNLNSPYTKSVNDVIFRVKESGLITKWKSDEMDKIAKLAESRNLTPKLQATSLADMTAAFMALGFGMLFAVICFFMENMARMTFKNKTSGLPFLP